MNCYVDEHLREQGIGRALVRALIPKYKEMYQHQPYVDHKARVFYMRSAPELFELPRARKVG
jgi:GNAT superfamily N-acetyltransferase